MAQIHRAGGLQAVGIVNHFGHTGDFFCFVANSFQIRNGFNNSQYQAQVAGGGLAARNDARAVFIDAHFQAVDAVVFGDHMVGQREIPFMQGFYGMLDLLFYQSAHFEYFGANGFKLYVKLFGDMF